MPTGHRFCGSGIGTGAVEMWGPCSAMSGAPAGKTRAAVSRDPHSLAGLTWWCGTRGKAGALWIGARPHGPPGSLASSQHGSLRGAHLLTGSSGSRAPSAGDNPAAAPPSTTQPQKSHGISSTARALVQAVTRQLRIKGRGHRPPPLRRRPQRTWCSRARGGD